MTILLCSSAALLTGFALDLLFGDPYHFPHIVRWMGSLIAALDQRLPRSVTGGAVLLLIVGITCTGIPFAVLFLCSQYLPILGYVVDSFLCWQLLAEKSLKTESMKVYHSLREGNVQAARKNLSMIVGRDTAALDADGITRATVETIAENTSDGVTAPLLYIMLGGAWLGCLYKAVNTMDSMVGYKNDRYLIFGRIAAKTDDLLNYIPSRLTALLMIAAAFLLRFNGKSAFRVWRRDKRKHASPNSAQTEAVCAGALGIRLAGPASYHGKTLDKPFIGDNTRCVEPKDIKRANQLMHATAVLTLILAMIVRLAFYAAI